MSGPVHSKMPHVMHAGSRVSARGGGRLVRRAGLGAAALVLMLAPATSQMRGPNSVEQSADRIRFPNVGDVRGGFQIPPSQVGDEDVEFCLVAPDNHDMPAQPRE